MYMGLVWLVLSENTSKHVILTTRDKNIFEKTADFCCSWIKVKYASWQTLCIILTLPLQNKTNTHTQERAWRGCRMWSGSVVEVIRLAVTGSAAGTGVHTAATVASLMGFNPTMCRHHYGTVNPLRWETSHTSALINTHRCRCDAALGQAHAHTHTHTHTHTQAHMHVQPSSRICQQFLTRITISFFPCSPTHLWYHAPVGTVWTLYLSHAQACASIVFRRKKIQF